MPRVSFFNSHRDTFVSKMEEKAGRIFETSEDLVRYLENHDDYSNASYVRDNHFVENLAFARSNMKERAREIIGYSNSKNRVPTIAVIDDYATVNANTIKEINRAFGKEIPAYAVFSAKSENTHFISGLSDVKTGNSKFLGETLSYYHTDAVGVHKVSELYAKRIVRYVGSAEALANEIRALRNEMRAIGERVVERLKQH